MTRPILCSVPLFVQISKLSAPGLFRTVSTVAITGSTAVVEAQQAEPIDRQSVVKNNFFTGYKLSDTLGINHPLVALDSPFGGKIKVQSSTLLRALVEENRALEDIPFKIGFHDDQISLLSESLMKSPFLSINEETEQLDPEKTTFEFGKSYSISQCTTTDNDLQGLPMRYLGSVGTSNNKRHLFMHTHHWIVQCDAKVRFRPAPDKDHLAPEFNSAKKAATVCEYLEAAADANWYENEQFNANTKGLSTLTPALVSHLFGCLRINGSLSLRLTGLPEADSIVLGYDRKGNLQLKVTAPSYRAQGMSSVLGDSAKHRGGVRIFTVILKAQVDPAMPALEQLQQFHEVLKEVIALKCSTHHEEGIRAVKESRIVPSEAKIGKEPPLRWIAKDLFWKAIR